ncbi:cupin domain-containing protein [Maridesulfovibrio bastinii]|uniref:cupin domain-containing protein n=1 Tax=Maridesulfovibrio bastinii TaxID=47157 RepID=UPI00040F491C|nr:cupin domain-containing protein [Maridesulfovibrio bastinii]
MLEKISSIKNIPHSEIVKLAKLVQYQEGQVVSRTISQNQSVTITLFAFDKGEGLSGHSAPGDALVQIFEGQATITIDDKDYVLSSGESIVMPAGIPHALEASEKFKMLLLLVK